MVICPLPCQLAQAILARKLTNRSFLTHRMTETTVCVLYNVFASLSFVTQQRCCLFCFTSHLQAEGQLREADEEDLVGKSSFVVYWRRILDAELFAARHARGCLVYLARLT